MESLRWVQLSEEERDEVLGRGGTGVISFSTVDDDPPFTIPVSYGYNADTETFYFRLAFPDDSTKLEVVERPVSFVVHHQTDAGWRSVVATGQLEEMTEMPYDSVAIQGMWAVQIPKVDIFDRPRDEITFREFRLVLETLSGRKEVSH
ncbi:pyridoxamine 5'-phosphate oxidase family protein [Haladaptatus sp. NG-SE-30]